MYERRVAIVKYLATQREITHPNACSFVLLTETWLDSKRRTVLFGCLERLERALFNGNSAIIPQEFDGLDAQLFC